MKRLTLLLIGIFAVIALVGCGKGYHKLGGRVTYSDDGTPLDCGQVCFDNGKHMARGKIDKNGYYTVGSFSEKDGLPPGSYNIVISGAVRDGGLSASGHQIDIPLIDPKYSSERTSGLIFVADGSKRAFDIQVERISPEKSAAFEKSYRSKKK